MKHKVRQLWKRNKIGLIAFVRAAAVSLFFVLRLTVFWIYWSDPAHRNQPIEGWMTPGYVAYSHHVPKEAITDALGLTPGGYAHKTLEDIAEESGRSIEQLTVLLNEVIETLSKAGE